MAPSKKASVGIVFVGMMLTKYHDMMITMLPKPLDAMALRMYYPDMETRMNTMTAGEVELPHITYGLPMDPLKEGETLDKIFNPRGYPTLLKGAFVKDQDEVVAFLSEKNKGKQMRMLNFEKYTDPHFSISCVKGLDEVMTDFDQYARDNLFTNYSREGSPYYAGFEAITDTEDVEKVLGIKSDQMGGRNYKMNNLFTSNFQNDTASAGLHCAPIDSLSIQLVGTKTWYFVGPDDLKDIPSTPLPTFMPFPHTDDELLKKVKHVHVVKQEPGDAVYFGPNWCHSVWTDAGPNVMFNLRYQSPKLLKGGPKYPFFKALFRGIKHGFKFGKNPQDNRVIFGDIYEYLNHYFTECGPSKSAEKLFATAKLAP